MIGILAAGLPRASEATTHPVLRTYDPPTEPDVDPFRHLADVVAPTLRRGATVLVLLPDWAAEPLHARIQALRSAFDTTSLLVHRTSLPPLAAGVFAETVAELLRRELLPAGVVLSRLDRIAAHVRTAAWLGSVARLKEPAPTLGLHARSYVPGATFAAIVGDEARVVPLKRNATTMDLPTATLPGPRRAVVTHGPKAEVDLVRHSLGQQMPDAAISTVELSEVTTRWWGTAKLVELALVPTDLAAIARDVADDAVLEACAWCDRAVLGGRPCPYCGDDRRGHDLESTPSGDAPAVPPHGPTGLPPAPSPSTAGPMAPVELPSGGSA